MKRKLSSVLSDMIFPNKLKAATAWEKEGALNDGFWLFYDRVNNSSQGSVGLKWIGGPDVIPPFELLQAVKNGDVDIVNLAASYYISQLPECDAIKLSTLSPEQERASGFYDYMNKLHQERANVWYLGRTTPLVPHYLYMNTEITEPDLEGMPIRITSTHKALVEALGGATITTAPGELYTALKMGIISGYGFPAVGASDLKWDEVTKYVVEPGVYQTDVVTLVNLDTWRGLTPEKKKLLTDAMIETEKTAVGHFQRKVTETRRQMRQKGVKDIVFSPELAEKYLNIAYTSGWEQLLNTVPQNGPKLKELLGGDRI